MPASQKWEEISSLLGLTSQKINRFGNVKLCCECFGKYNNFKSLIWMFGYKLELLNVFRCCLGQLLIAWPNLSKKEPDFRVQKSFTCAWLRWETFFRGCGSWSNHVLVFMAMYGLVFSIDVVYRQSKKITLNLNQP